jgi:hypothetical protein
MKLASRLLALTTLTAAILSVTTIAHAAPREAEGAAKSVRTFPALTLIYRFTGLVTTSLDAATGVQVSAHCTNFHPSQDRLVRYFVRGVDGGIVATAGPFVLNPFRTFTYSTQFTTLFFDDSVAVPTTELDQGSLQILASGPQVHCSAQLVDASGSSAYNVTPLPAIRSNQEAGTEE